MFGIFGLILATYGLITGFSNPQMYGQSLGYNVNLIWGCVMLGFSVVMLGLARRAKKRALASENTQKQPQPPKT
jgi:hypothetical protein